MTNPLATQLEEAMAAVDEMRASRVAMIMGMRERGITWREISEDFGISRVRAIQLVGKEKRRMLGL